MRAIICGILVFVSLAAATGCRRVRAARAEDAPPSAAEADVDFDKLLAGKDEDGERAMEARLYLSPDQPRNGLWKTSRGQTLEWVNDLYQAGAAKVYAIYSPADETIRVNMCASLLIELPSQRGLRGKVLSAYDRINKRIWGDDHKPTGDDGQKYLMLNMDP